MKSWLRTGPLVCGLVLLIAVLPGCSSVGHKEPAQPEVGYFDPHNHAAGVLPWPAYANLPAYIDRLEGKGEGVTTADKLAFYTWLDDWWYPKHRGAFDDRPFSSDLRFGLGARATLALFPARRKMAPALLDGALTRIFTATPFTEFDNAYAFHGPAYAWLTKTYYQGNRRAANDDLCTAQVLELARTHITSSEQSISFIGGWRLDGGDHSFKLQSVFCAAHKPQQLKKTLARLNESVPRVRIILMTHTNQLGENSAGDQYKTFDKTGRCHAEPLPEAVKLSPKQMYYALLGKDKNGKSIISTSQRPVFFDTLAGIDTAAPEMTCFSDAGMAYYRRLVDAVYRAAKKRRERGWTGKLLVHTHVGEGFSEYYAKNPPQKPWTFDSVFARVPVLDGNVVSNARVPRNNIDMLLDAVAKVRRSHPDLDRFVVVRFGHVTHSTLQQAREMARLHIEADVNLDSNLSTGAWSFADMPDAASIAQRVSRAAARPGTNFELNNLPQFLIPEPDDVRTVASVLGTHPLKHLLMANVRVMLGTDGAGVEHASMAREYAMAASLVAYWKTHDRDFKAEAGSVSRQTFRNNARWHLRNMAENTPTDYN